MIFETHAHYESDRFKEDQKELLESMADKGVGTIVNVGSSLETSKESVELAHTYDFIWAAVGVHPEEIADLSGIHYEEPEEDKSSKQNSADSEQDDEANVPQPEHNWFPGVMSADPSASEKVLDQIRQLAHDNRVVSIGEIGLDYYWVSNEAEREHQRYWFRRQLDLAEELNLPVIIHSRDAAADTMEIMKEAAARGIKGVIHCYSYSKEQAEEYVKMGYFIGVGGVVTFKNGRKLRAAVEAIPMESIVIETDAPYMAPEPHRGQRNQSEYLVEVAKKIAEIKNLSYDEVVEITEANAKRLYPKVTLV